MVRTTLRVFVVLCAFVVATAFADTVHLKDGRTFQGRVIAEDKQSVRLEVKEGATLTFSRDQIKSLDRGAEKPRAVPSSLANEIRKLSDEVSALRKELANLKSKIEKLSKSNEEMSKQFKLVKEIKKRTQQVAGPRGDASEELRLADVTARRAGDDVKVDGYITATGRGAGRWVRIVAELQDDRGRVLGRGYTTPDVATPGTTVRDASWVHPGRNWRFNVYVPCERRRRGRYMSPDDKVVESRVADEVVVTLGKREGYNRVVVRLEIPPRYKKPGEGKPK